MPVLHLSVNRLIFVRMHLHRFWRTRTTCDALDADPCAKLLLSFCFWYGHEASVDHRKVLRGGFVVLQVWYALL